MEPVSIIIPTYNRADIIKNSIQSILNQSYTKYELIIVDDGSADNTKAVISEINDSRVRYIKMPENRGAGAARNEGVKQARYDYIAFQDSDDYWKEEKLGKQMDFLCGRPATGLVYCPYECEKNDGSVIIVPDEKIPLSEKQGNIYKYMLRRNTIGTPGVLMRKECFKKSGMFREDLSCLEDWELFLRVARDYEIGFLDEPLLYVNLSSDGVSHNMSGYYQARCYMAALHKDALKEYGIFSEVTRDILGTAQELGILPQVSKMMEYYLQN